MTFDEFTEKLKDAAWRATCDARYDGIEKLYHEIMNQDRAAREECARIAESWEHAQMDVSGVVAGIADEIRETMK
jgi:hypothetical protein